MLERTSAENSRSRTRRACAQAISATNSTSQKSWVARPCARWNEPRSASIGSTASSEESAWLNPTNTAAINTGVQRAFARSPSENPRSRSSPRSTIPAPCNSNAFSNSPPRTEKGLNTMGNATRNASHTPSAILPGHSGHLHDVKIAFTNPLIAEFPWSGIIGLLAKWSSRFPMPLPGSAPGLDKRLRPPLHRYRCSPAE